MKSILDPTFKYSKAVETDIRKTFARVRREMAQQQRDEARPPEADPTVLRFELPTKVRK